MAIPPSYAGSWHVPPPFHRENTREWADDELQMNRIEYIEKLGWLLGGQQAEADLGG